MAYNKTIKGRRYKVMNKELQTRMNKAIKRIGGTLALLELPAQVREIIANCPDYETRVKMLELTADQLGK